MILEPFAIMLAGIGLLLSGLKLNSMSLKKLSGKRFRKLMSKMTGNYFLGAFWGFFSGAIFQNISNISFILIGLISAEVLKVKRALPIISWAGVGISLVVFIISLNIYIAVLIMLGISGIYFGITQSNLKKENILLAFFGISIMLLGIHLIKDGSKPLADLEIIKSAFDYMNYSLLIPILFGFIIRTFIQSSLSIVILTISFLAGGLINFDQMMLICYGTALGDGASAYFLSSGIKGTPREIAYYSVILTSLQFVLLTSLFFIEKYLNVPLVKHFVLSMDIGIENQAAMIFLLLRLLPTIVISFFQTPVYNFIVKICPPTMEEELSKPKYLTDLRNLDTEMALQFAEKEHLRIITRFLQMIDNIGKRNDEQSVSNNILHKANLSLFNEIGYYMRSILEMSFPENSNERFILIQNQLNILSNIEENLYKLVDFLNNSINLQIYNTLVENKVIYNLYVNLRYFNVLASMKEPVDIDLFMNIAGDRSPMIINLRELYHNQESVQFKDYQNQLIDITNLFYSINHLELRWIELMKEDMRNSRN
jgi:phosphate:Na+ symporter